MIRIYRKMFTPVCDGCGAELPYEDSYAQAVAAMRAAGWISARRRDRNWEDLCTFCHNGLPGHVGTVKDTADKSSS